MFLLENCKKLFFKIRGFPKKFFLNFIMYLNFRNFDMNIIQRTEPRDLYIATVLYFQCKQCCYLVYLRIELFLHGSLTENLHVLLWKEELGQII